MKIYVAASSSEIERAEKWIARLREAGFTVVSMWPEVIRRVGEANPMTASREERAGWAATDLGELSSANVFWLLLPERPSAGAYTELGYALLFGSVAQEARAAGVEGAPRFRAMCSGKETSIFTALALHYDTDEAAFEALQEMRA